MPHVVIWGYGMRQHARLGEDEMGGAAAAPGAQNARWTAFPRASNARSSEKAKDGCRQFNGCTMRLTHGLTTYGHMVTILHPTASIMCVFVGTSPASSCSLLLCYHHSFLFTPPPHQHNTKLTPFGPPFTTASNQGQGHGPCSKQQHPQQQQQQQQKHQQLGHSAS